MLRTRVIPSLLLRNDSLVKTVQFGRFTYIGDPCNTVRIFNELEVDELLFLDITATVEKRPPNLKVLSEIADECFMPLAYGGGVTSLEIAKSIFDIGIEKVAVNTCAIRNPEVITEITSQYGSQSLIASIDVKKSFFGKYIVCSESGKNRTKLDLISWAKKVESLGAGEILLTSIDKEGSWDGFDVELVKSVTAAVGIPVIANGGAGNIGHIASVVNQGGASAVAVGSMVTFQKKGMGVLVNFPNSSELKEALSDGASIKRY